jgi:hypothetical protein
MRRLLVLFLLVGCGDLKATKQDSDHIRRSSDQIQQDSAAMRQATERLLEQAKITNHGIHLQTLSNALTGLLTYGGHIPLLAPYAKIFDDEASPAEILEISRVLLLDARLDLNPKSYVVVAVLGGLLDHDKFAALMASQMPQGPYQDVALAVAGLRYWALKTLALLPLIEGDRFTVGSLQRGVATLGELKFIVGQPWADQVKVLIPMPTPVSAKEVEALGQALKKVAGEKLDAKDPAVQKLVDTI